MNRFEKRKLKANIYKHANTLMYVGIFVMASIITIAAALNRTDNIMYVDETKLAATKESVEVKNSDTNKVASTETEALTNAETAPETTSEETNQATTKAQTTEPLTNIAKVKVTADTLKVRAKAAQDSDVMGLVGMDEVFEVISQDGEWIQINYNGRTGYISSEFAEFVE